MRPTPTPPAPTPPAATDAVKTLWRTAREHLLQGRAKEALAGYEALLTTHANVSLVKENVKRIEAGRIAARAALEGPRALLSVKPEGTKERLELEYLFDDPHVLDHDFGLEKPFSSDLPVDGTTDRGEVVLKGATGLMHVLVFAPDVKVTADVTAVIAKDFGALAVEESDKFRAVMFDCANTRFKLKKGDAAKVQPGHVLWFMGEGVWSGADPGEHGFIKIAERPAAKILNGDRVALEFARKGDHAEGGFQGHTDGVFLEGNVKGDDGGKMGAARVGLFTNGGEVRIRKITIAGVVDRAWWAKRLAELPAGDPGPD